jgi:prepilin peptidase CpaA
MDSVLFILLAIALSIAVIEDVRRQKIPNLVTFPGMVVAIVLHCLSTGLNGFLFSTGGLAVGMGLFLIPYMMGGMGAGDIKLMGAAGAVFGPKGIIIASILVVLAGGLYGFIIVALHPGYTASLLKRAWKTIKIFAITLHYIPFGPDQDNKLPAVKFAIPIALGAAVFMWMKITGYDLLPEMLGDNFKIFSIAISQGGTG